MTKQSPFAGGVQRGRTAADYFRIVAHYLTRYKRLSFGAKGLQVLILGLPPEEVITEEALASYSTDGIKVIRRYLVELQTQGFLVRGERMRYPKGTVNAKGKPIGGALGPYQWFATDQLEEVTAILEQRRLEQESEPQETAGQDYRPEREPGSVDPVDNSDLPAEMGGSSDQAKQGVFQDQSKRPNPPVGIGSSYVEEQELVEEQEQQDAPSGRVLDADSVGEPDALRLSGPEKSAATSVGGSTQLRSGGDHQTARGRDANGSGLQWHGIGSLAHRTDVAGQHERNRIKTGARNAPSYRTLQEQRRERDPQARAAALAELERQRAAGPRRAPIPSPPPSTPPGGVIPPEAVPPVAQRRSEA